MRHYEIVCAATFFTEIDCFQEFISLPFEMLPVINFYMRKLKANVYVRLNLEKFIQCESRR
jgi:hypothetical protein